MNSFWNSNLVILIHFGYEFLLKFQFSNINTLMIFISERNPIDMQQWFLQVSVPHLHLQSNSEALSRLPSADPSGPIQKFWNCRQFLSMLATPQGNGRKLSLRNLQLPLRRKSAKWRPCSHHHVDHDNHINHNYEGCKYRINWELVICKKSWRGQKFPSLT